MVIDYHKFRNALVDLLTKADGTGCEAEDLVGKDLLLEACRQATEDPTLTLSKAERQQVKQVSYSILYGSSARTTFANLRGV